MRFRNSEIIRPGLKPIMRKKIPSTHALLAFESAARHQSFTRAAEELALTQSAVCRQINALEDYLGVPLFRRTRRGVQLTEAGQDYSRQIGPRLDALEQDTLAVMSQHGTGSTLDLAVVPTFATRWLLPRLGRFQARQPEVIVNLHTQTRPFLFDQTGFDAAIYFGDAGWPGTEAHFLMHEYPVPVCSPTLPGVQPHMTPEAIAELPLLQQSTRPYAWRRQRDHTPRHDRHAAGAVLDAGPGRHRTAGRGADPALPDPAGAGQRQPDQPLPPEHAQLTRLLSDRARTQGRTAGPDVLSGVAGG